MSKILIPANLKGKELFKFLVENKSALIAQKKSILKTTDAFTCAPVVDGVTSKIKVSAIKAGADAGGPDDDGDENDMVNAGDKVHVTVVANSANWIDSQMDLLVADCWKKSIKERKGLINHLHDHIHQIQAKVGEVTKIYSKDLKLRDLGVDLDGSTQALIFETDVFKSYNEQVYNQYKLEKINQHSIGLQYINISLAINDEDSEKEFDFWNKYYPLVINKDVADENGYFWVVKEIKLLENSCVLFGANELTPTLDVKISTEDQPSPDTEKNQPPTFDSIKAIKAMVMCPNCKAFYSAPDSGSSNCPSCGQYVSPDNNQEERPTFDSLAAIAQTKFI